MQWCSRSAVALAIEDWKTVWRDGLSGRRCDDVHIYVRVTCAVTFAVTFTVTCVMACAVTYAVWKPVLCSVFLVLARRGSTAGVIGGGCGRKIGAEFSGL